MPAGPTAAPQSVERILAILEHLAADRSGAGLAQLARSVDAPKTSLIGLLAGMVASGHLTRDGSGVYRLGPRMFSLAMRVVGSLDLSSLARPVLEQLVADTGETALLGALAPSGDLAIYIDKVESRSSVRYTVSLGEQRELYSSSIGKLLLAHMPAARQDSYLRSHPLTSFTAATITSVPALRRELETIRAQGFAQTRGERVVGADAMAAPVYGPGGEVLAALVVAGPSERMRGNWDDCRRHLLAAAARLSQRLPGRDAAAA
ncbi:IclR family transcriptional regulator [Ramlibacter sp.]|uniref:IclR family transcriptional regulator n=1 Tax=Ramlibacter sp. TaxID=1917967 RepID=UPI002BA67908|nr:IclR family transcriptional regulator [Ramlibacter sp.]HWI80499.1 IclR family transcriptional regulator [Ramlibacter sp.]